MERFSRFICMESANEEMQGNCEKATRLQLGLSFLHQFVEVKSHNDRLSFHQIVWLDKLVEFELDCEVCKVHGKILSLV